MGRRRRGIPYQLRPQELDIYQLLLQFLAGVQRGGDLSFAAFKQTWQQLHFSYIFEAPPYGMVKERYVQMLYSIVLDVLLHGIPSLAADQRASTQAACQTPALTVPGAAAVQQGQQAQQAQQQAQQLPTADVGPGGGLELVLARQAQHACHHPAGHQQLGAGLPAAESHLDLLAANAAPAGGQQATQHCLQPSPATAVAAAAVPAAATAVPPAVQSVPPLPLLSPLPQLPPRPPQSLLAAGLDAEWLPGEHHELLLDADALCAEPRVLPVGHPGHAVALNSLLAVDALATLGVPNGSLHAELHAELEANSLLPEEELEAIRAEASGAGLQLEQPQPAPASAAAAAAVPAAEPPPYAAGGLTGPKATAEGAAAAGPRSQQQQGAAAPDQRSAGIAVAAQAGSASGAPSEQPLLLPGHAVDAEAGTGPLLAGGAAGPEAAGAAAKPQAAGAAATLAAAGAAAVAEEAGDHEDWLEHFVSHDEEVPPPPPKHVQQHQQHPAAADALALVALAPSAKDTAAVAVAAAVPGREGPCEAQLAPVGTAAAGPAAMVATGQEGPCEAQLAPAGAAAGTAAGAAGAEEGAAAAGTENAAGEGPAAGVAGEGQHPAMAITQQLVEAVQGRYSVELSGAALLALYCLYCAQPGGPTVKVYLSAEHQRELLEVLPKLQERGFRDAVAAVRKLHSLSALVVGGPLQPAQLSANTPGGGLKREELAVVRELKFHFASTLRGLGTGGLQAACSEYEASLSEMWAALSGPGVQAPKSIADLEFGKVLHDYSEAKQHEVHAVLRDGRNWQAAQEAAAAVEEEQSARRAARRKKKPKGRLPISTAEVAARIAAATGTTMGGGREATSAAATRAAATAATGDGGGSGGEGPEGEEGDEEAEGAEGLEGEAMAGPSLGAEYGDDFGFIKMPRAAQRVLERQRARKAEVRRRYAGWQQHMGAASAGISREHAAASARAALGGTIAGLVEEEEEEEEEDELDHDMPALEGLEWGLASEAPSKSAPAGERSCSAPQRPAIPRSVSAVRPQRPAPSGDTEATVEGRGTPGLKARAAAAARAKPAAAKSKPASSKGKEAAAAGAGGEEGAPSAAKRPRGRPRRDDTAAEREAAAPRKPRARLKKDAVAAAAADGEGGAPKKPRARPRKGTALPAPAPSDTAAAVMPSAVAAAVPAAAAASAGTAGPAGAAGPAGFPSWEQTVGEGSEEDAVARLQQEAAYLAAVAAQALAEDEDYDAEVPSLAPPLVRAQPVPAPPPAPAPPPQARLPLPRARPAQPPKLPRKRKGAGEEGLGGAPRPAPQAAKPSPPAAKRSKGLAGGPAAEAPQRSVHSGRGVRPQQAQQALAAVAGMGSSKGAAAEQSLQAGAAAGAAAAAAEGDAWATAFAGLEAALGDVDAALAEDEAV